MVDPSEIERRYYKSKKSVSPAELFELAKYYTDYYISHKNDKSARITSKAYKTNVSPIFKAVFFVREAFKAGAKNREHLEFYRDILRKYSYNLSHNYLLLKVIKELRELDGISEPAILKKVRGVGQVEGGTLAIRDISYEKELEDNLFKSMNDLAKMEDRAMQEGKFVIFGTGGDGSMGLQLRLVEGELPMLSDKEYKISTASTPEYVIKVPSGKVKFSEFDLDGIEMEVEPGNYKCVVFVVDIPSKFFGYYAVLAKTAVEAKNPNASQVTLEPY